MFKFTIHRKTITITSITDTRWIVRQEAHGPRRSPDIIMNNVFDKMGNLTVNRACGSSSTIDKFWPVVHEKKIFNVFAIYDPRVKNHLTPRMFHAKYQYILRPVVHEKIFLKFINIFLILPLIGPQRGQPLYLNKSESPSRKHVSLKFG